jgi:hypothetical protein
MNIIEMVRGAMRRAGEVSLREMFGANLFAGGMGGGRWDRGRTWPRSLRLVSHVPE